METSWCIRLMQKSLTCKDPRLLLIFRYHDATDHPQIFKNSPLASSTPRAGLPISAQTTYYVTLCLQCWRRCPLLTAHCGHCTDTLASQCSLVTWQGRLVSSLTTMPTSSSHQLRPSGDNNWFPLIMKHTVTNTSRSVTTLI